MENEMKRKASGECLKDDPESINMDPFSAMYDELIEWFE